MNSRANSESNVRTTLSTNENNGTSSPRFSSFRPASEQSMKPMYEFDTGSNVNKPLWNSNPGQQQTLNSKSPISMDIDDHELFVTNKIYNIYLSNLEVPNVVFAATLDDYVNATLLITQMNKHEQLAKVQANSYKSK